MNDDPSSGAPAPRSWLDRLGHALSGEPRNRAELLEELRQAQANGLLTPETLAMIEGALTVAEQHVGDVMRIVVESGHSRFPVTGEDGDEIVGILLAKGLLRWFGEGATTRDLRAL